MIQDGSPLSDLAAPSDQRERSIEETQAAGRPVRRCRPGRRRRHYRLRKMHARAIQTANYITYYMQPDDRIVVGFDYNQWWYSCHAGVVYYLFDFLEYPGGRQTRKITAL